MKEDTSEQDPSETQQRKSVNIINHDPMCRQLCAVTELVKEERKQNAHSYPNMELVIAIALNPKLTHVLS